MNERTAARALSLSIGGLNLEVSRAMQNRRLGPGPFVMPQDAPGANLRILSPAASLSSISSTATDSTIASTTEADAGPAEEPAANEANCERREDKWEQVD
eukprot:Skav221769  [mRNA]  locus=scaffold490:424916:425721:- [translate_table: standard]